MGEMRRGPTSEVPQCTQCKPQRDVQLLVSQAFVDKQQQFLHVLGLGTQLGGLLSGNLGTKTQGIEPGTFSFFCQRISRRNLLD